MVHIVFLGGDMFQVPYSEIRWGTYGVRHGLKDKETAFHYQMQVVEKRLTMYGTSKRRLGIKFKNFYL